MPQKEKAELNGWQYLFKQQKKSGKTAFYVMLFSA